MPGASSEKRIGDPVEDGSSPEETCPAVEGGPVNDLDSPAERGSQQRRAASWYTTYLMLESFPHPLPRYRPTLGFPQSRPETAVQGQAADKGCVVTQLPQGVPRTYLHKKTLGNTDLRTQVLE